MKFPPYFQFNQGNLQNFADCPRRFYLQSIRQLAWPAVISEPFLENELREQQGAAFHRLLQQHFIGIPTSLLILRATQEPMQTWFSDFLRNLEQLPGMTTPGVQWQPEKNLTDTLAGFRLVAKFDLLGIFPDGSAIIFDWKTSHHRPRRQWLAERIQTRLYRYLLVKAGRFLRNEGIQPEQVSMVYWFTAAPEQLEILSYSSEEYRQDDLYLEQTIKHIAELVSQDIPELAGKAFPLTLDEKRCSFCKYRSLCARGVQAGNIQDLDEYLDENTPTIFELDLSFDQVAEIEY